MIRIVVQSSNCGAAANVGGPVVSSVKTFDVNAPELEAFLAVKLGAYQSREVIGAEVLRPTSEETRDGEP